MYLLPVANIYKATLVLLGISKVAVLIIYIILNTTSWQAPTHAVHDGIDDKGRDNLSSRILVAGNGQVKASGEHLQDQGCEERRQLCLKRASSDTAVSLIVRESAHKDPTPVPSTR